MATVMKVSTVVPQEIASVFQNLYHANPVVTQDKKNTIYSVPGEGLSIMTDPYGGCHIVAVGIPAEKIPFVKNVIQELADKLAISRLFDSLWIDTKLPAPSSDLFSIAPYAFQAGMPGKSDVIYDYQQKMMRSWVWLNSDKECTIPAGATHNISSTAIIMDLFTAKVFLVVYKDLQDAWNLPRGSHEPAYNAPCCPALWKAFKDAGLAVPKEAFSRPVLVSQMQFPYNQFAPAINQTWAFFVNEISQIKLNPPEHEVVRAEWVDISSIRDCDNYMLDGLELDMHIIASVKAVVKGRYCKEIKNVGLQVSHVPRVE